MKIMNLNNQPLTTTKNLVKTILTKDIKAFKASNRQFIHNNQTYSPGFKGLLA
jgi:hypothetical protein